MMEFDTYNNNTSQSFSCDTSMLHGEDLNMFVDIMEEMCAVVAPQKSVAPPTRKRSNLRRSSQIKRNRYVSDRRPSIPSDTANDKSAIEHFSTDIFSYFDEDVILPIADSVENLFYLDTPPPTPPRVSSLASSPLPRSPSPPPPPPPPPRSPQPTISPDDSQKNFRCTIKDVIYKNPTDSTNAAAIQTSRRNTCNRLRSLVNLFENCNIVERSSIDVVRGPKSMSPTTNNNNNGCVDDRSCGSAKQIIEQFNKQLTTTEPTTTVRCRREQPAAPALGKFKAVSTTLEKFFREKLCINDDTGGGDDEKQKWNSDVCERNEKKEDDTTTELVENGMENMLIKYNKLKTLKTFFQTHNFMTRCHDICADMSDRLFDGLENSIVQHEGEMFKYFESLTVINWMRFTKKYPLFINNKKKCVYNFN